MGYHSDDTDVIPTIASQTDAFKPGHTNNDVIHNQQNHHVSQTQSCIDESTMAEGGTPGETPIPLIPPPPPAPPKNSPDPLGDTKQTGEPISEPIPEPVLSDDTSFESIDIAEEVLQSIEKQLEDLEYIPDVCDNIPIECFCEDTQHRLCYHLDPESHTEAHTGLSKDYMGFGEWIGLETLFMKYLHRTVIQHKTIEVLGKWITFEGDPRPTIGNFKVCMIDGIDRPDVVSELAKNITRDAIAWVRTGSEACTVPHTKTDKSWQLTRHDVVAGKKTYYTCCLVYADEDEGMAQVITKLYKSVYKKALFFLPQFDLRVGKYEFDATAKIIQERCEGRVIFLLSEYFFASEVCRFAVHFSRAIDAAADAGNLIPFHLTNKYDHVPRVIKGIAGIRWFRNTARKMSWSQLTDTILGGRMEEQQFHALKSRLQENIEREPDLYLCDPPYDKDTPSPGPPIDVHDPPLPEEMSCRYDPGPYLEKRESEMLAIEAAKRPSKAVRVARAIKNFFTRNKSDLYGSCTALDQPTVVEEKKPNPNSTFYDTSKLTGTGGKTVAQQPSTPTSQHGADQGNDNSEALAEGLEQLITAPSGNESPTQDVTKLANGDLAGSVSNQSTESIQNGGSGSGMHAKDDAGRDGKDMVPAKSVPAIIYRRSRLEPEENDDGLAEKFV